MRTGIIVTIMASWKQHLPPSKIFPRQTHDWHCLQK